MVSGGRHKKSLVTLSDLKQVEICKLIHLNACSVLSVCDQLRLTRSEREPLISTCKGSIDSSKAACFYLSTPEDGQKTRLSESASVDVNFSKI